MKDNYPNCTIVRNILYLILHMNKTDIIRVSLTAIREKKELHHAYEPGRALRTEISRERETLNSTVFPDSHPDHGRELGEFSSFSNPRR